MNVELEQASPRRYSEALERLQNIVRQIEEGKVDIDDLESLVEEAVLLINECRTRLTATQKSVEHALGGLAAASPEAGEKYAKLTQTSAPASQSLDPFADE